MPSCWRSARPSSSVLRRRDEGDVQPLDDVDLVVVDLGEDDLLLAGRACSCPCRRSPCGETPLKSRTRGSAKRDRGDRGTPTCARARSVTIAPMGRPSRSLKVAIAFLARVTTGFWPVMARMLLDGGVDDLRVRHRRAEAHVDDDLLEARNLHRVLVAELLRSAPGRRPSCTSSMKRGVIGLARSRRPRPSRRGFRRRSPFAPSAASSLSSRRLGFLGSSSPWPLRCLARRRDLRAALRRRGSSCPCRRS